MGAVQNVCEIQATIGELFRVPQPATLEHLKSVIHAKIGRVSYKVSYKSVGNHAWGVPFCSTLETCAKPVQLYQTTNREQPHFCADFSARISSKTRSRGASFAAAFGPIFFAK